MHIKFHIVINFIIFTNLAISEDATFSQLKSCKEYKVKDSVYKQFFRIDNLEQNNRTENELIRLNFYVLTLMDAHILLSEADVPQLNDNVYDIVIGAGGNTYSTIRAKLNSEGVVRVDGSIEFDPWIPTPIEISQTIDGKLTVYVFNEVYLTYLDNNPLLINFVSFKSYGGIPAKWFYDCKFNGHEYDITLENTKFSDMERLEQNLFSDYDSYNHLQTLKEINFSFNIKAAFLDIKKSTMRTHVSILMTWQDSRLKWNSTLFGDINIITGSEYNIWMPILIVNNGAEETYKGFQLRGLKQKIYEDGKIEIETKNTEITTWCTEDDLNWPFNKNISCEIEIGALNKDVHLLYNFKESSKLNLNFNSKNKQLSWNVKNYINLKDQDEMDKIDLVIEIILLRNKDIYLYLYYTPIIVCMIFILSSFFLNKSSRGILNILSLIIILLAFLSLGENCIKKFIPPLVFSYIGVLLISTMSYLLHVIILCMKNQSLTVTPYEWVLRVTYSRTISFLLGMSFTNRKYFCNNENPWDKLAQILNRISFILVFIIFSCIILKDNVFHK